MIGLDVGSCAAKKVWLEGDKLLYKIAETRKWRELLDGTGEEEVVSTGYFRNTVPHLKSITEITAAIYGARHIYPEVEVIVDIGGQDTKVIDSRTNTFNINDKCGAGTGAFLEFVAGYLGLSLGELSSLHFKAEKPATINNTCGVFALSEIISQLVGGSSVENVVAGMHLAFARRIAPMIPEAEKVVLIGGAAKNKGMVASLEDILGKKLLVPEEPQIVNALGALRYWMGRWEKR